MIFRPEYEYIFTEHNDILKGLYWYSDEYNDVLTRVERDLEQSIMIFCLV